MTWGIITLILLLAAVFALFMFVAGVFGLVEWMIRRNSWAEKFRPTTKDRSRLNEQ